MAVTPFVSSVMYSVPLSSSSSSPRPMLVSKVKKKNAVLKRAMTQRHAGWSSKDWKSRSKSYWLQSAGEDTGESSQDKWKNSNSEGNRKKSP